MINYDQVGLKVGLEIHRQLNTRHKLFCGCPTRLTDDRPELKFLRRLRPTQSELGQVDPAALFEFQKGRLIEYESDSKSSCLVEMDEEPPHDLNGEAVEVALTAALLLGAIPVDEVHVMRKIVIDGSNTTGFQRTCVVALGGSIAVNGKTFPIQQVSLEEDAARKTGGEGNRINYRIDRLGIPLIEVSTSPDIASPEEAGAVAAAIGGILRATGKVKRGLGSVRQDLNISIRDGALTEVKGLQELELLPKVVAGEVERQVALLEISSELKRRGLAEAELKQQVNDVSDIFARSKSKIVRASLEKGGQVGALKLRRFAGFLSRPTGPGMRLGAEFASRASFWGGVSGIFHSDELPGFGISETELKQLKARLRADDHDAVVLVADLPENVRGALDAVLERAREALMGVPSETRMAMPDGSTKYMRPRPGAARMYPETDIPPTEVTPESIERIRGSLPPPIEQRVQSLMKEFTLSEKLAVQLIDSEYLAFFERIAPKLMLAPSFVATVLTENLKSLQREGVQVDNINDGDLESVFLAVDSGKTAKESVADLLRWMATNQAKGVEDAIRELGLGMMRETDLERVIQTIVQQNLSLVKQKREGAVGALMGTVMREVRGRADASAVDRKLRAEIERVLKS